VVASAFNEKELHDVKISEQYNSVFEWVKRTNKWKAKQESAVHDFIVQGEAFGKVYWDTEKGQQIGLDEEGMPIKSGEFVIEKIFPFEFKRDPSARSWEEVRWGIHEQLVDFEDFKDLVKKINPEMVDKIKPGANEQTYQMFDTNTMEYREVKDKAYIREFFYRPCSRYPNGWYILHTTDFIIMETELPFGVWPIAYAGFDQLSTSPRSSGIIRVCRPYQVEVNRSASKMAEHQITLGDDKVFIQKGTKLSNGGKFDGVRAFQVAGKEPTILQGRSGAQYLEYQLSQIKEMYEACNLTHILEDKQTQGDPFLMLYASMKDKKKFVRYVEKYERFETDLFDIIRQLAKHYLGPYHIIKVAGSCEAVNIEEFKRLDDRGFEIKVDSASGDVETRFGSSMQEAA